MCRLQFKNPWFFEATANGVCLLLCLSAKHTGRFELIFKITGFWNRSNA